MTDLRSVVIAGHRGDLATAKAGRESVDATVRAAALGALERLGALDDAGISESLADPSFVVRRRAAELAAAHPGVDLLTALEDGDARVVEVAAWACGEHESAREAVVDALIALASNAEEPLVREAAVAALGAIGDDRALEVIIAACADKPAVRRRAVLALAPFEGDNVDAAVDRALADRDWQVRQAAEDLRRAQS